MKKTKRHRWGRNRDIKKIKLHKFPVEIKGFLFGEKEEKADFPQMSAKNNISHVIVFGALFENLKGICGKPENGKPENIL